MEQIPSYNLLQAIDPTKIKVPISDRFAKLTLSSNKKQQEKCDKPDQPEERKRQQEKRDSVSRNISKQFEDEEKAMKQNLEHNPLLRSESSRDTEYNNSADAVTDAITMEPLEVSQDFDNPTQLDDDLELLSQRIASMAVEPKAISLSSSSSANFSVLTELFSSESQSSSTSEVNNVHIVRHIPINVKEALKQTISLNLTSSTNDNLEKTYEISEDEDDEESEVITVSDTSESHHEQEQDLMAVSSLPSTSLSSENLRLPSLMDDKVERVAAFLRDVSVEQRAMEQGHVAFNITVDQILENQEIDKIQVAIAKSQQIATADTESMTPDADEDATPKSLPDREKRLKDIDDFQVKGQVNLNNSCNQGNAKNVHRLTNNDIQDNTVDTDPEKQNDMEKTPRIRTNFKTQFKDCTAKTPRGSKKNVYRIANDETQCNSEHSVAEETPKMQLNTEGSRRMANLQTEDNTEFPLTEKYLSPNKNKQNDSRRLVNEDTVSNSMADIDEALTQKPGVHIYSPDYKTPEKSGKTIKSDKTRDNSSIKLHLISQSSTESDHYEESFASVINSSSELNVTAPEHSITISETDDENSEQNLSPKNENSGDKKLSNSFHREDSGDDSEYDEKMSKIQMSMASINISAKINIKIHIPNVTSTETSEDDQNYKPDIQVNARRRKESNQLQDQQTNNDENKISGDNNKNVVESNEQNMVLDQSEKICKQLQLKTPIEEFTTSPKKSSDSVEFVEDEKFVTEAEKLLNQLYGKSWQTPDVIRTLKRSSQSGGDKKPNDSKSLRKNNDKNSNNKSAVEESILDDFSIFRRNIVKTNLDSTRLGTPKSVMQNKKVNTDPRNCTKSSGRKAMMDAKHMPQTERKQLGPAVAKVFRNKGRVDTDRWRNLIDNSNSEGDNASDDDDADESWSRNASDLELDSDSDFKNSPKPKARNRKNNTIKRSDKSAYLIKILNKSKDGEIVYLDLSKEEVEVQDEVPESPPANHDVTFASHLDNILKTCRHEDKAKLPSSNKKTKRKLFTPNFGDDDFEAALPKEDASNAAENIAVTNRSYGDENLEDNGNCPFDSQGRIKILNVVNKQLESVKTGKPVFQITPSPKKKVTALNSSDKNIKSGSVNTPKLKLDNDPVFKTPSTLKSRGPAKALVELYLTPDYKYSFLKSLDVAISKSHCHPNALYYRDNYRTKKEDLSKILYDMYNEKLFKNKLDVPISWNKKLLNTAGRCLNKKKLGIRSSVVELSDKVLTSADRLRCTLIHEMCHAATWIFSGEGGHGSTWKEWARRANAIFPEIPKIGVCHQYDIEYKYTYKCTLCGAKSHAHSKSKKVENIRCSYCHGAIEIFLNKKDKDGNIMPTPVKEPTGFAKFVKDNYKKFKRDDLKHTDVMKLLSSQFASLKVAPIEK